MAVGEQHVGVGPAEQAPGAGVVQQVSGQGLGLHALVKLRGWQALAALVQAGGGLGLQDVGRLLRAELQQIAHIEPDRRTLPQRLQVGATDQPVPAPVGHRQGGQGFGGFERRGGHFEPGVVHRRTGQRLLQQPRGIDGDDKHWRAFGPVVAQRLHKVGGVDRGGVDGVHTQAHGGQLALAVPHRLVAEGQAVQNGVAQHGVAFN